MTLCTQVPGCPRNHYARGYCYNHYTQARRLGKLGSLADLPNLIRLKSETVNAVVTNKCIYSEGCNRKPAWLRVCLSCRNEIITLAASEPGVIARLQAEGRLGYEPGNEA